VNYLQIMNTITFQTPLSIVGQLL